jgi:3-oxoacyl-[acyl-carrier-protein] synthase-3
MNPKILAVGTANPPLRFAQEEVFRMAVSSMSAAIAQLLEANQLTVTDVSLLIPHQANSRIIDAMSERLKLPQEKIFVNVGQYGNTSAASVPLAPRESSSRAWQIRGTSHCFWASAQR